MKLFFIFASTIISVLHASKVIELNSRNFDAIVDGTRNVFVKFEASWCGPCKALAPILEQVARESFSDLDGETIIARIDADSEAGIADRFDIEFFPTLKLFFKGKTLEEHLNYDLRSQDRTPAGITKFIQQQVNNNLESSPELANIKPSLALREILSKSNQINQFSNNNRPYLKSFKKAKKAKKLPAKRNVNQKNSDPLPDVDAETAKKIIANAGSKPVIMLLYSPNCPHCYKFLPEAMKYTYANQHRAIFIRVNGDANIAFRDSFKLTYYPAVIGFYPNTNGQKWEKLSEPSLESMDQLINKLSK